MTIESTSRIQPGSLLLGALPAAAALASSLAVELSRAPLPLRIAAPVVAALAVGVLLARRQEAKQRARHAADAEAMDRMVREAGQMRHDLRGILSPALLMADRLAMSQDTVARRAGETMIATVERAEERLRRDL